MRHIREIYDLPVSQLTDEEILKCAFKRLGTKAAMLVYESDERLVFLGRYRKGGYRFLTMLNRAWEERFGKFKKNDEEI